MTVTKMANSPLELMIVNHGDHVAISLYCVEYEDDSRKKTVKVTDFRIDAERMERLTTSVAMIVREAGNTRTAQGKQTPADTCKWRSTSTC